MIFIEETTSTNKFRSLEQPDSKQVPDKVMSQKIIDFEPGRKALRKVWREKEQIRASPVHRSHLPRRLLEDRLEFLLMIALLLGLYVALIGSWGF
jgi:hypothetical protein